MYCKMLQNHTFMTTVIEIFGRLLTMLRTIISECKHDVDTLSSSWQLKEVVAGPRHYMELAGNGKLPT